MDNVKLILFIVVIVLDFVACSRKGEQTNTVECEPMVSAYEVEFSDNSVRKSEVTSCNGTLTATALDQSKETVSAPHLTIRLVDKDGREYFTSL